MQQESQAVNSDQETKPVLFPVIDLFPDEQSEAPVIDVPDVNHYRRAFRAISWYRRISDAATADEEKVIEQIRRETENVKAFYEHKRKQAGERINLWLGQLDALMKLEGVEKKATPYGTSFYRKDKKKEWNADDAEILAFAKETGEKDLIKVTESPVKKMIEEYINSTGKGEHLLTITPLTKVSVRLRDEESA